MGVGLVVTDANHVDSMMVEDYSLDCAWGKDENDFELTVDKLIPQGAFVYLEESECGGIVDALRDQLERGDSTLTYSGRTWHGMLENKILAPDSGQDYLTVSGNASTILGALLSRVSLTPLFKAVVPPSGDVSIKSYQFERYVDAYTGVCAMAKANGLKLKVAYRSGHVETWLETAGDYGNDIDSDLLDFDASRTWRKPNHMIGLGKGELRNRIVSHWYADSKGNVTQTQTFKGLDEIAQVYDYSSAEADELAKNTKKKLQDLQSEGEVKVTVHEDSGIVFDVGDTVTARDNLTGITVNATISKKIVKVSGGVLSVDYEAE